MTSPAPYGSSSLNNFPLDNKVDGTLPASGISDFPCKLRGSDTYTLPTSGYTSMPLGSTQEMTFEGSAVHGGGSCQVSISYDLEPTANSTFKVIHSVEGGCPMMNIAGNNGGDNVSIPVPDALHFAIPETFPTGKATLAWTWFNKVGNREMYMNCAPIEIGSNSTTKRDQQLVERDMSAYNALPDIFVANIGGTCGTEQSTDLLFPDPGESVERLNGATTAFAAPTSCTGVTAAASGVGSAPSATSAISVATTSSTAIGGVFATESSAAPAVTPISSVAALSSTLSTSTTVSASTPSGTGTTGSGSAFTAGTACSTEGMWNCIGGSQFQECASGVWSAVQGVAAGTTCTSGQSMNIDVVAAATKPRRSVRFSRSHAQRNVAQ